MSNEYEATIPYALSSVLLEMKTGCHCWEANEHLKTSSLGYGFFQAAQGIEL